MLHPTDEAALHRAVAEHRDPMLESEPEPTPEQRAEEEHARGLRARRRELARRLAHDEDWTALAVEQLARIGVEEPAGSLNATIDMTGEQWVFYRAGVQSVFRYIERLAAEGDEP